MTTPADPQSLSLLSLSSIRHRCAQESNRFFQRQSHDPRYCFELFRRAIVHQNELAWDCVYQQYQPLVISWIERYSASYWTGEEVQYFLNRAFEKMWQGLSPEKFENFSDLKSLLRYLQMCTYSVITDFVRWKEQVHIQEYGSLPEREEETWLEQFVEDETPEDDVAEKAKRQQLWQWIESQCNDEREWLIVHGTFVLDLKPRHLAKKYGNLFSDAAEVSRVKDNFLARLRRNANDDQFDRFA